MTHWSQPPLEGTTRYWCWVFLDSNTTGTQNTGVGYDNINFKQTLMEMLNTVLGQMHLGSNTGSNNNTAVGRVH